jgi:lipopolysaccharide export system protein LptA
MNLRIFSHLAATAALALAAFGQGTTPRSENELLKTIDSIGAGGPSRKPLTLEGTSLDPAKASKSEKKAKGQTEITALEGTFDQKTREAVFIGNVVVKDPEFTVVCDRLIALLKKQTEGGEKGAAGGVPAAKPSPAADPPASAEGAKENKPKGGGLDKATAEANPGKMVEITQDKLEADGSLSKNIGLARKATYDAKTGDIVLIGSPSVQQGINTCVATSEETIMILNRNGQMRAIGPHKMIIKETGSSDSR